MSESLESRANHSNHEQITQITSKSLTSHFFKEQQEWFTHGRSFLMSEKSVLAICSWLLFFKEWRERITHSGSLKWAILSKRAKSERAKSQPFIYAGTLETVKKWWILIMIVLVIFLRIKMSGLMTWQFPLGEFGVLSFCAFRWFTTPKGRIIPH